MMGLVSIEEAEQIKRNARVAGLKVYDNGHYFTVDIPAKSSRGGA